ncbi:hypothetical protein HZA87_06125 [Candidatus Uhrbacteria bacterium]|nr:hypothetical protein [Candidatus Uhrbacteria bacterium]
MERRDFLAGGLILPASALITPATASTTSDVEPDDNEVGGLGLQEDTIEHSAWYLECTSEEIAAHSRIQLSGLIPAHADQASLNILSDAFGSLGAGHGISRSPIAHQMHPAMQRIAKDAVVRVGRASFVAHGIFREARERRSADEIHRILENAMTALAADADSQKTYMFPREIRRYIAHNFQRTRERITREGGASVLADFERRLGKLHRLAGNIAREKHDTGMFSTSTRIEQQARVAAEHWAGMRGQSFGSLPQLMMDDLEEALVGLLIMGVGVVGGVLLVMTADSFLVTLGLVIIIAAIIVGLNLIDA